MTYHALCYKHRCRGGPDAKRKRRLEQLDVRIEKRLGPGVELGQRAGGEDIEQRAGGKNASSSRRGKKQRRSRKRRSGWLPLRRPEAALQLLR